MTQSNLQLRLASSRFLRYSFALALVAIALGFALLVQRYDVRAPRLIFLFALAVSAWYTGRGPTVVTVVLSIARKQALPLLTMPVRGWLTSCATEAASSPIMLTRLMCARSASSWRK